MSHVEHWALLFLVKYLMSHVEHSSIAACLVFGFHVDGHWGAAAGAEHSNVGSYELLVESGVP